MNGVAVILFTAVISLATAGCDKVISSAAVGNPHKEVRTVACRHTSYCFTCMPGFGGGMKCKFKMSPSCPGKERVRFEVTPMVDTYESGIKREWESVKKLKTLKACS